MPSLALRTLFVTMLLGVLSQMAAFTAPGVQMKTRKLEEHRKTYRNDVAYPEAVSSLHPATARRFNRFVLGLVGHDVQWFKKLLRKESARVGESVPVRTGAGPREENFRFFYLEGSNLVLLFSEYQVGSFVAGEPSVSIPAASLKTIAAPDGPLVVSGK